MRQEKTPNTLHLMGELCSFQHRECVLSMKSITEYSANNVLNEKRKKTFYNLK